MSEPKNPELDVKISVAINIRGRFRSYLSYHKSQISHRRLCLMVISKFFDKHETIEISYIRHSFAIIV